MTYQYRYDAYGHRSSEGVNNRGTDSQNIERLDLACRCYDLIGPRLDAEGGMLTVNLQGESLEARLDSDHSILLQLAGKPVTLDQLAKADLDLLFGKLSNQ